MAQTVSLEADYLRYDQDESVWASGNVHLVYGEITLDAKQMTLYARQNRVVAQEGVSVNFRGRRFYSKKMVYALKDEDISFNVFSATLMPIEAEGPLYFESDELQKHGEVYTGGRSRFSSCPPDRAYYSIEARKFVFYPRSRIEGYDVYAHAGGIPIFYSPYYEFALGYRNPLYLFPAIGSSFAEGAYVKSTVIYHVNRDLQTNLYFDVLERMGYGSGVKAWVNKSSKFPSEIYAYGIAP
ncbi:MAG: LptA/OstA family protein, partial [Candidatus Margulisiibacteriota bacterium]